MGNMATQASSQKKKRGTTNTQQMVTLAIFIAIAAILSLIEIPLIPAAPHLKYDPSGVVSLIAAFLFGPIQGVLVAALSWVPRIVTNPIGAVMNTFAAAALVIPAGIIYKKIHTQKGAIIGMLVGAIFSIVISIILNFIATPLYFGGSIQDVMKMVLPILIPFNTIKMVLNCIITFFIYKPVHKMLQNMVSKKKGPGLRG